MALSSQSVSLYNTYEISNDKLGHCENSPVSSIILEHEEEFQEQAFSPRYLDPGQNTPTFDSLDRHIFSQVEPGKLREALMNIFISPDTHRFSLIDSQIRHGELEELDDERERLMTADESNFSLTTQTSGAHLKFVDVHEVETLGEETDSDSSSDEETLGRFYTSRSYAFEDFKLESDDHEKGAFLYWAHTSSIGSAESWLPVEYIYRQRQHGE